MNLCFVLGSSRELSLAELTAILNGKSIPFDVIGQGDDVVELSLSKQYDERELMDVLGGCIKIGSFLRRIPRQSFSSSALTDLLHSTSERRLAFGISVSSVSEVSKNKRMTASQVKRLGIDTKRELKELGVASRCVISQDDSTTLSSVVVEKNKLLQPGGIELILIQHPEEIFVYATKVVQPFEEYSRRDFGRPSRSMAIGMLPPKVARMMINMSDAPFIPRASLCDPFCGTGTILQEAALLGVRAIMGLDNSQASLDSAKINIAWLKDRVPSITTTHIDIQYGDARELHTLFRPATFDTIVTETYLGPVIKKNTSISQGEFQLLEQLYITSLRSFYAILKPGGCVVIALPFWPSRNGNVFLPTLLKSLDGSDLVNITRSLLTPYKLPPSNRNSILWYRENQQVGREICVFKRSETRTRRHRA